MIAVSPLFFDISGVFLEIFLFLYTLPAPLCAMREATLSTPFLPAVLKASAPLSRNELLDDRLFIRPEPTATPPGSRWRQINLIMGIS